MIDMVAPGPVVWFTGVPASGKSTIAACLAKRLREADVTTVILDSDDLRKILTPNPTYASSERDEFYAAIAGLAERISTSGATVLIAATASKRAYRDVLRGRVDRFVEVFLRCDDERLEARDPKGLYRRARAGEIQTLPGRGAPYEAPLSPERSYDTGRITADEVAAEIEALLRDDDRVSTSDAGGEVRPAQVERYLRRRVAADAHLVALAPLGTEVQEGLKAHGYGKPLRMTFDSGGARHDLTLRTMGPDQFGHDRRADRFDGHVLAFDEFRNYPQHIVPVDVGVIRANGAMTSVGGGEPFLVTSYVDGELYAHDLSRLSKTSVATARDRDRALALASYLAALHRETASPDLYRRAVRDLVGHGEGVFGLMDAFLPTDPIATPKRLRAIEHAVLDWRWQFKDRGDRARRTHGDFHPFNILFREGVDFTVLDASRGGVGDPADDVTCLSINYLFFALAATGRFDGPLRELWDRFWNRYLEEAKDTDVLGAVAPYFAWRSLVLVCPAWYPDLCPEVRDRILRFAERLLEGAHFTPDGIDQLLA